MTLQAMVARGVAVLVGALHGGRPSMLAATQLHTAMC